MPLTVGKTLHVTIVDPVTITTASLPPGMVGTAYSVQLVASGGIGPFTWGIHPESALPTGLTCDMAGLISGTPTATFDADVVVQVTDAGV